MPYFKNEKNKLFWLDEVDPKFWLPECVLISDEEVQTIRDSQTQKLTYSQKRAAEYPPMADYLDGIVKGDIEQVKAYIAACLAVKVKYPKV